jgi:hypothetical protein
MLFFKRIGAPKGERGDVCEIITLVYTLLELKIQSKFVLYPTTLC